MIQLLHYRKLPVPLFFIALLFMGGTAMAQKTWTGAVDNSWNTPGNWNPAGVPGAADAVTIANSVNIVFNAGTNNAGTLTISGNATVQFAPAAAAATLQLNLAGTTLDIQAGSRLNLVGRNAGGANNFSLLFAAGAGKTGTIDGTLSVNVVGGNDIGLFSAANSVTTVNGTLRKAGGTINSNAANLVIGGTGSYNHAMDDNAIVTASWNFGSTVNVTGVTATLPTNLNQTYTNLIWNCTGQTGNFILFPNFPLTIPGNMSINSTGTGSLAFNNNNVNRNVTVNGNFTQTGGTFIVDNTNGGSSLTVDGNMLLTGTQNFFITTGTGNATVNANGPFTLSGGTLTMSSSAAQGILNASGNFTHSAGTITETSTGSGLINFNGTGSQVFASGSGTVSGAINYEVASGSTLQMAAASTVVSSSGGTFTLNSGATLGIRSAAGINLSGASGNIQVAGLRDFSPTANYTYNGTVAQVTGDGIPFNLTGILAIANGAGVTLSGPESIGTGGTVALQSGVFATGTNLTLNTGAIVSRSSGTVTGTFAGTGDYDVVYTGSSKSAGNELQGGQGGATRLRNLTMSLTNSIDNVILNTVTEMKGLLTLTQGLLSVGNLTPLRMVDGATTTGGSPSSYVSGPITKLGNDAFVFPLGTGGNYRPVAMSGSAASIATGLASTANTVTASLSPGNPLKLFNRVYNGDMISLTSCYFWNVSRVETVDPVYIWASTGPSGGASLNTDFLRACMVDVQPPPFPPITPSLLRVARYTGTLWDNLNNATPPVTVQSGNAWFIGAATPVTTFSPFAVGSAEAVLPVTFTSFTGLKDGNSVRLNWETSSEQNSAYFDVERSSDGVNFSSIGKVNAAGNSASLRKYSFTDNNPATGRNFYRLRQVDLDEKFEYSKTISVNMAANAAVSIYPNPVQSNMMVEYPKVGKGAIYKVLSVDGRVMQSGALQENSSQQTINLSNLQRGNYLLVIQNDGQQYVQKIVKQ